jgi:hypothetical protein
MPLFPRVVLAHACRTSVTTWRRNSADQILVATNSVIFETSLLVGHLKQPFSPRVRRRLQPAWAPIASVCSGWSAYATGGGGTCNGAGVTCSNNLCVPCGTPGSACCSGNVCGGAGCCYGNVCLGETTACGANGGTCQAGRCSGCGSTGQTCCSNSCYATPFLPSSIWSIEFVPYGGGTFDFWIDDVTFYE